jgi:hypothetical protein
MSDSQTVEAAEGQLRSAKSLSRAAGIKLETARKNLTLAQALESRAAQDAEQAAQRVGEAEERVAAVKEMWTHASRVRAATEAREAQVREARERAAAAAAAVATAQKAQAEAELHLAAVAGEAGEEAS